MNGYVQIKLGDKLRGLKFNLHAIKTLESLFPNSNIEQDNILQATKMIYAGLCGNRYIKTYGTEPVCEETFEEVSDWVDEWVINKTITENLKPIFEAFASSKAISNQVEEKKNLIRPTAQNPQTMEETGLKSTNTPTEY